MQANRRHADLSRLTRYAFYIHVMDGLGAKWAVAREDRGCAPDESSAIATQRSAFAETNVRETPAVYTYVLAINLDAMRQCSEYKDFLSICCIIFQSKCLMA